LGNQAARGQNCHNASNVSEPLLHFKSVKIIG